MKIVFVHKQILFPRDTGGKIRALNLLKHLAKWHEVTYICNLRKGEEELVPQMQALGLKMEAVAGEPSKRGGLKFYFDVAGNLLSNKPFSINRNFDPAVRQRVQDVLQREPQDILICDCVQMALHTIGFQAKANILFQHNVEAQILRRHAEISPGKLRQWYMRGEWRKMQKFEQDCGPYFDAVIAVSVPDKILFEKEYGWKHVHAIDTAVDEEFFQPDPTQEVSDRVMFLGSMDWMPNQDGVKWFVREVWPQVKAARPNATFQIVGRNPPLDIRALTAIAGVEVVGSVPDVRPYLNQASVMVVPLLVGGGTRLKIYEGMVMARPIVSTAIGAEGLPVVPGEHYLSEDQPTGFAQAVIQLLHDPSLRQKIGQSANTFVRQNYGSEPVARQFEQICQTALNSKLASVGK